MEVKCIKLELIKVTVTTEGVQAHCRQLDVDMSADASENEDVTEVPEYRRAADKLGGVLSSIRVNRFNIYFIWK